VLSERACGLECGNEIGRWGLLGLARSCVARVGDQLDGCWIEDPSVIERC
jgi:hypothetical protein